jgi:hypothetical protein
LNRSEIKQVKRCPTCNQTFSQEHLVYCVDDGTPLVVDESGDEATVVRPSAANSYESGPKSDEPGAPAYQAPRPYTPPDYPGTEKRASWGAVLGIALVVILLVAGMGVAAAVLVPRMMRASVNARNPNPNFNREGPANSNWNANQNSENWNENNNAIVDDTTPPPTDQNQVRTDLQDLENEWTVANINADRKKLNRILADDYVGISNGQSQGKAEYLKTIERDTSIAQWRFQELKVTLNHDRAALTGIITLDVKTANGDVEERSFRFTDKFVWRDARWQATGSEVIDLEEKSDTIK